ncbi:izumo sperm-egg fusion protein 1 isoform X1 [Oryzias melastigma]|uniref:izumo sperm-egg fusion protein 1 isoform X1 n=1 Tax=Oryzias melastigma TaxID=30732 RepID=UPI000CF8191F|nr:izumo sperm-egg fusion protein 1 isoform X1 [Oryzias melastigma]XP_024132169.1 izumo sperm-egg fusion protein 1 isoform X1 [Oryzias melastigma]
MAADSRGERLLMLVYLLCCVPAADTCLQCERIIRVLHEDLILSAPAVKYQVELTMICDQAYENYKLTSRQRKGVIDPTTFYRVRTEYQSEFNRFWNMNKSGSITSKTIQILEKGNRILEKHLDTFIRDGLCPNKCGFLKRRLIDCLTCKFKTYICPSPSGQPNCGENPVQAEEGGQVVFSCYQPWHYLISGKPEYYYSWAPVLPGTKKLNESDFVPLVVTHDSSVVLNQLQLDEQGTYRCSLQEENRTIFYQVTFLLTVTPLPCQTLRSFVTLPSLPYGDSDSPLQPTEARLVPVIAMAAALSLIVSVGLTVALGLIRTQKREANNLRRRWRNVTEDTENNALQL